MKTGNFKILIGVVLFFFSFLTRAFSNNDKLSDSVIGTIDRTIVDLMEKGHIPGLSLVIINGNEQIIKSYGYADVKSGKRVSSETLFELGSCSKAFTALCIAKLVSEQRLNLEDAITKYIPWLRMKYKEGYPTVTIRHLLHHTSGIPWNTISLIPESNSPDALLQTVKLLATQKLNRLPGAKYEYATINYDVLALVIENITHQPFETYLQKAVFEKLQLNNTGIGFPVNSSLKATGYKTGFFKPVAYNAPVYRGNNAAGYVITNALDMGKWLQLQMRLVDADWDSIIKSTHQRDETVPLHDMSAYAMGWQISLRGDGEIFHKGLNPNFSSYIAFRSERKLGIAVLANAGTEFSGTIGNAVMKILAGEKIPETFQFDDNNDKSYTILSFILSMYVLIVLVLTGMIIYQILTKRRRYEGPFLIKTGQFLLALLILMPFLYGLYLLPRAMAGFNWKATLVWMPFSFEAMIGLILLATGSSYFAFLISLYFPEKNNVKRMAPRLLIMSILSGLANMGMIILITSALNSGMQQKYQVFYYILTLVVYFIGSRFVKINLIKLTRNMVYELRVHLFDKIFSTSYEKFEKMDRGRVYTVLNEDVGVISDSLNMAIMLITNIFTVAGAFLYLATIAFWATISSGILIALISTLYALVSRSTQKYFSEARDSKNVFMGLANGMIDGFKEISLHRNRKLEYKADIALCANEYREKISTANIRFVNASVIGESLLIIVLGAIVFAMPHVFPDIQLHTIMSFVVIVVFLIGPIVSIQNAIPALIQLKIAWDRLQQFLKEIPANLNLNAKPAPISPIVESIRAKGVKFTYQNKENKDVFAIGPIDLEVKKGEILFIIGGNGSGKSTLVKLLSGLYEPEEGTLLINNEKVDSAVIGEYFSAVFSPYFLFEKLYDIDVKNKAGDIDMYLRLLNLDSKVKITNNKYGTINLSSGQRKRLALLQCYAEDSPIFLFDEWAADQDPEYKNFFYRTLLPQMKVSGKIIIAITHDNQYFDVADKVMKMEYGRLYPYSDHYAVEVDDMIKKN